MGPTLFAAFQNAFLRISCASSLDSIRAKVGMMSRSVLAAIEMRGLFQGFGDGTSMLFVETGALEAVHIGQSVEQNGQSFAPSLLVAIFVVIDRCRFRNSSSPAALRD